MCYKERCMWDDQLRRHETVVYSGAHFGVPTGGNVHMCGIPVLLTVSWPSWILGLALPYKNGLCVIVAAFCQITGSS
jgi:hypothetical protein